MHYEVIAYCCNCSVKLVENVVNKLSKQGYLTHTINDGNRILKKQLGKSWVVIRLSGCLSY